jgi:hypothetical protein
VNRSLVLIWAFVVLTLLAYSLPWIITPSLSLTLNAYDLAEWTGLNPAVRGGTVPLLPTLALRLIPALIALWFGQVTTLPRWIRLIMTLMCAVALLPPLEFFTGSSDDPNFRQQFGLAISTALSVGLVYAPAAERWRFRIRLTAIIALVLLSVGGLLVSMELLRDYQLPLHVGLGGILLITCVVIAGIVEFKMNEVTGGTLPR